MESYEDVAAQNPFTAVGFVKPGGCAAPRCGSRCAGWTSRYRHVFHRDNLAGVRTIHFARWLPIDDGRRLVFASSYDGSLESYMDDFIDRLAWGVNVVFSNGVGYPRTRWLVLGGARDEPRYKRLPAAPPGRRRSSGTPPTRRCPRRNVDDNTPAARADLTARLDEDEAPRMAGAAVRRR